MRCEQLLDKFDVPEPFDLDVFLANVARLRGRQIRVRPFAGRHGLCGAWISTRRADYIYYDQHTTGLHQMHILVHEVAHMLLEHGQAGATASVVAGAFPASLGDQDSSAMPGRCAAYTSSRERDAERLASVILERSCWQLSPFPARSDDKGQRKPLRNSAFLSETGVLPP